MDEFFYVALTLLKLLPLREVWSVYKPSERKKKPSAKTVYLILIPQAAVVSLLSSPGLQIKSLKTLR